MTAFARPVAALAVCAAVAVAGTAHAQTPPSAVPGGTPSPAASAAPVPSPSAAPEAARCEPRAAGLGGIGRVTVVSFTGPIFGGTVCAIVASIVADAFAARVSDAVPDDALLVAGLTGDGDVSVPVGDVVLQGAGPYAVAPGGVIPGFGADTSEAPRVVLAYSGSRILAIATSPVTLADLARTLRAQPSLFGADAFERAVVIASGHGATMLARTAAGPIGTAPTAPRVLVLTKR